VKASSKNKVFRSSKAFFFRSSKAFFKGCSSTPFFRSSKALKLHCKILRSKIYNEQGFQMMGWYINIFGGWVHIAILVIGMG